jgi:uncharacterized protein YcbK (DUF882 family)
MRIIEYMKEFFQKIPNFDAEEFRCNCGCGQLIINKILIKRLQKARDILGDVIFINSGTRCTKHNTIEKGTKNSSHLDGTAVDISCNTNHYRFLLLSALIKAGFTRIGITRDFIHVDVSPIKDQQVSWIY